MMNVTQAVQTRRAVRGYLDTPIDGETIRRILATAAKAPSGGNLQPWILHVVGGEKLLELKATMRSRIRDLPNGEETEYSIYPPNLWSPFRERRFELGESMYKEIGIGRDDKAGRMRSFARNYEFFGAPLALFCSLDRRMGPPQWSDVGMLLQTVMLLLREQGLHSCAQECWALYPRTVGKFLNLGPELMLFCGMAIGHEDTNDPINRLVSRRAPLEEPVRFLGI
jgi:nitroreductase